MRVATVAERTPAARIMDDDTIVSTHDGVASFGKPMFNNELPPFETFLFDFDADIYGRHLEIALISHIRGQEVYKHLDELIAAISRDSRKARIALGECDAISDLDRTLGFFA